MFYTDSKPALAPFQVFYSSVLLVCTDQGLGHDGGQEAVKAGSHTAGEEHSNHVALLISILRKEPAATATGLLGNCVSEDLELA